MVTSSSRAGMSTANDSLMQPAGEVQRDAMPCIPPYKLPPTGELLGDALDYVEI